MEPELYTRVLEAYLDLLKQVLNPRGVFIGGVFSCLQTPSAVERALEVLGKVLQHETL